MTVRPFHKGKRSSLQRSGFELTAPSGPETTWAWRRGRAFYGNVVAAANSRPQQNEVQLVAEGQ